MGGRMGETRGPATLEDADYLQACRRVLSGGVLTRDRAEVLSIDPSRWPAGAAHLRDRIAATGGGSTDEVELEMLDFGHDLQVGLAETVEQLVGVDVRLADALLRLQSDCARVRFVFEETAMRLRRDPERFHHGKVHGELLHLLAEARLHMRGGRWDDVRRALSEFRRRAAAHAGEPDGVTGRPAG